MDFQTTSMEELKAQATDLGIAFKGNISKKELIALIEGNSQKDPVTAEQSAVAIDSDLQDMPPKHATITQVKSITSRDATLTAAQRFNLLKTEAKKKASRLVKVIISNLDSTETELGSVPVVASNQYFALSAIVPFGTPVELPTAVVKVLASTKIVKSKKAKKQGSVEGDITEYQSVYFQPKYSIQYV